MDPKSCEEFLKQFVYYDIGYNYKIVNKETSIEASVDERVKWFACRRIVNK